MDQSQGVAVETHTAEPIGEDQKIPVLRLFRVWFTLGIQSFGGGTATQYLIYRGFVERTRWITPEEFTRAWAICPLTPGINLLGLTVLIGWRLAGPAGVAASLLGLLLPSVTITAGMTAIYASIRDLAPVHTALRGIIPATVGMGLIMMLQLVRPPMADSRREGRGSVILSGGIIAGSAALSLLPNPQIILILVLGGMISALAAWRRRPRV
jgi:chromate transporter